MKIKLFLVAILVLGLAIFLHFSNKGLDQTKRESRLPGLSFDYFKDKIKKQEGYAVSTIVFTGDIMLARNVDYLAKKNNDTFYAFKNIVSFLQSADHTIGNLEGPIIKDYFNVPTGSFRFSFPPSVVNILSQAGFDMFSLANNHMLDAGKDGWQETKKLLNEFNINSIGQPFDSGQDNGTLVELSNKKVMLFGLYAFNHDFSSSKAIENISRQTSSGVIDIVFVHWGSEYQLKHNYIQEELAHSLIDQGVDMIIGHHPHVVQDIEEYNNRLIFYSLGNFIFDQYFSKDTQQGLVLKLNLGNIKNTVELFPVNIIKSQPELMKDNKDFLNALSERSGNDLKKDIKQEVIQFIYN